MKQRLLARLERVERLARAGKWQRLMASPGRYLYALGFRETLYRWKRQERQAMAQTVFGAEMEVALPAGTDIYLLGAKTHDSEIRLARFMARQLQPGDAFVDVGAHFGYFALLASQLVGESGSVYAFEAARSTFRILERNLGGIPNCQATQRAVASDPGSVTFYEFDALYSEYNSMAPGQFEGQAWFQKRQPDSYQVKSIRLDRFLSSLPQPPALIKIDVEGAEEEVIRGAQPYLERQRSTVVMEYLAAERGNAPHRAAAARLRAMGYTSWLIQADGQLYACPDIEDRLREGQAESDNIVFAPPKEVAARDGAKKIGSML